ncbi:MAG: hypothetical protein M0Z94_10615 [Dehalococcoidales bacterium]|nr:hypothetical protein [Dehalococcoidales bacterium]
MPELKLTSRTHSVEDSVEAIEFCYRMGWTDGLPVVPPTAERVAEFLANGGHEPGDVLGGVPDRRRVFTAEKVAINAVMAGCLPAYAPVVFAAVEAMSKPGLGLSGASASTGGAAILAVVSGPLAREIGLNGGGNALGPGARANATIGRALRLVLLNLGGATPGVVDRSTLGHPGKYAFCLAEDEGASPWEPLRVDLGFPAEVSTVTVMAAEGPHQVSNHASFDPEGLLLTFVVALGATSFAGAKYAVVICPEHVAVLKRAGWSKRQVKEFLAANTWRSVADLKRHGQLPGAIEEGDDERRRYLVADPEDFLVVVAGGEAGGFSAIIPPWAGGRQSLPQTQPIGVCVDCN